MAPARSLSPVATTRPEPIVCTTGSKKHELNLSKATVCRRISISMSLLVPLLEFKHQLTKTPGAWQLDGWFPLADTINVVFLRKEIPHEPTSQIHRPCFGGF